MKYRKQIVFFLFINLFIVFLSIYIANLTRKLELSSYQIKQDIEKYKEQLSINMIEFSFYNNSDYLKKLHSIYFSFEEENIENRVISFSNISIVDHDRIVLVNLKDK